MTWHHRIRRIAVILLAILPLVMETCAGQTAQSGTANLPDRELVVGTKEAPPFAMKSRDGAWEGISIELWRRIAEEMRLRYRFEEQATVQGLIDGVTAGRYDAAIAAITPTATRERELDFTQPYYASGLGIAVKAEREASWRPITRAIFSFGFAQAVLALLGLALSVGLIVWLFERKRNDDFAGGMAKGLGSGVIWSASAMTQRGTGNLQPLSFPGRVLAALWMVVSVIAIAIFTAGLTSALTTRKLHGVVNTVNDLATVRVGHVSGTSSGDTLTRMRIDHRGFPTLEDGLKALQNQTIDALVHDRPILTWIVREQFSSTIEIVNASFDAQNYAIALPTGSPLRKPLNAILLGTTQMDWWHRLLFQHLGSKS